MKRTKPLIRGKGGIFEPQPNLILMKLKVIVDSMKPVDHLLDYKKTVKSTKGEVNTKGQAKTRKRK